MNFSHSNQSYSNTNHHSYSTQQPNQHFYQHDTMHYQQHTQAGYGIDQRQWNATHYNGNYVFNQQHIISQQDPIQFNSHSSPNSRYNEESYNHKYKQKDEDLNKSLNHMNMDENYSKFHKKQTHKLLNYLDDLSKIQQEQNPLQSIHIFK
jgi:hypothetical protein